MPKGSIWEATLSDIPNVVRAADFEVERLTYDPPLLLEAAHKNDLMGRRRPNRPRPVGWRIKGRGGLLKVISCLEFRHA